MSNNIYTDFLFSSFRPLVLVLKIQLLMCVRTAIPRINVEKQSFLIPLVNRVKAKILWIFSQTDGEIVWWESLLCQF